MPRPRITYANVTATLALVFAMSGGAYALTVSGEHVENGSLTGKDIAKNSITAKDVDGLGANVVVRQGDPVTTSQLAVATADCDQGEDLVSGGYQLGGNVLPDVLADQPAQVTGTPRAWHVVAFVNSPPPGASFTLTPYAVCAS
jgi:hypothetical protein